MTPTKPPLPRTIPPLPAPSSMTSTGFETVTIIHGKGTGALRKGIHEHLRRMKQVKSYRLGVYGEGEDGVTVVSLK